MILTAKDINEKLRDAAIDDIFFSNETFSNLQMFGGVSDKTLWFSNCTFTGIVQLLNIHNCTGVQFHNCQFNDKVEIRNSNICTDEKSPKGHTGVVFKTSKFTDDLHVDETQIHKVLNVENCVFTKNFILEHIVIKKDNLILKNCTVKGFCQLQNLSIDGKLIINSINAESIFDFSSINAIDEIAIRGSNFYNDFFLRFLSTTQEFTISHCTFQQLVSARELNVGESLQIDNSHFDKTFHINLAHENDFIKILSINNSNFLRGLLISGHPFSEKTIINVVEIVISSYSSGSITISSIYLSELFLNGFNNSTNLHFDDLHVSKINVQNFINSAGVTFSNITPVGTYPAIWLINNNFGKTHFFSSNFDNFLDVIAKNNILTDIASSQMHWFSDSKLNQESIRNSITNYKLALQKDNHFDVNFYHSQLSSAYTIKQEFFRQLKLAAQKQGNIPEALEFGRIEMSNYKKSLLVPNNIVKLNRQLKRMKRKSTSKTIDNLSRFGEKFILVTNQTNNYGQSWTKAVLLFFPTLILLAVPISLINNQILNLRFCFILINPAHSIKDLYDVNERLPVSLYIWDVISRIIVAYFIFQIVSAFRKFNK